MEFDTTTQASLDIEYLRACGWAFLDNHWYHPQFGNFSKEKALEKQLEIDSVKLFYVLSMCQTGKSSFSPVMGSLLFTLVGTAVKTLFADPATRTRLFKEAWADAMKNPEANAALQEGEALLKEFIRKVMKETESN